MRLLRTGKTSRSLWRTRKPSKSTTLGLLGWSKSGTRGSRQWNKSRTLGLAAVAGAALVAARRIFSAGSSEWQSVTVNRPPDQMAGVSDRIDTPVGAVEVEVRPGDGGEQTELAARVVDPAADADNGEAAEVVRQGLEETKAALEGNDR